VTTPTSPTPILAPLAITASAQRRVVEEARSWIGTPYKSRACVKGVGVDCFTIQVAVLKAALNREIAIPHYPPDWFKHTEIDHYKYLVLRYARQLTQEMPRTELQAPGNLVMVKIGRTFCHTGIITCWPLVVHATVPYVIESDALNSPEFRYRELEFYSPYDG
jgi:hypothetical protein